METILVVDDDNGLRETVSVMLEREGFKALTAADGRTGLDQALLMRPDLLLVDLRLPALSGSDLCRTLRGSGVTIPIIVLSAIGDEIDKVLLLEMGADDYMVKPFGMRELLARIRAVMRRSAPEVRSILRFSDVEIDLARRVVLRANEDVSFTPAEYNLLLFFVQNPDRPLSRDSILNSVWGYESYPNTRTVDSHVARLRQKLEKDPAAPRHFLTLHGVGYRFIA